jgi:hypothetical protein
MTADRKAYVVSIVIALTALGITAAICPVSPRDLRAMGGSVAFLAVIALPLAIPAKERS